jgi:cytochrome c556
MRKTIVAAVIGMLAAGAMVGGATVALAQADVAKQREANRKQAGGAMKAVKEAIDAKGDAKVVVTQAAKLKELEAAFEKMYPPGSEKDPGHSLPVVWSDMPGFMAASKKADDLYDKLAVAGGSGDWAQIQAAWGAVGKEGCGGCHAKYRAKLN